MHHQLEEKVNALLPKELIKKLEGFLAAINEDYEKSDDAILGLKHSFDLSDEELKVQCQQLTEELAQAKSNEDELKRYLDLVKATLESSQDGVLVVDTSNDPIVFNENFINMWSIQQAWVENSKARDIYEILRVQLKTPSQFLELLKKVKDVPGSSGTKSYSLKDTRVVETYVVNIKDVGLIWRFRDISEKCKQEELIRYQAYHDDLTNLPNRSLFNDRLSHALKKRTRDRAKLAIFYMDLDGFKTINDSLGHAVGDSLLMQVAKRLVETLRDDDTVARLGGDEFVVLMEEVISHADVVRLAERVLQVVQKPFYLEGQELYISTSIGVSLFPDDGDTEELLVRNADIAMYKAKDQGRNCFHFYTTALERLAKHRLSLETKLRAAVKSGAFELYYQPKICLHNMKLKGFEALLRWYDEEQGFIGPDTFIPIAESTGLILAIGEWVIEEACRQAKIWVEQGFDDIYIAINLSAKQFQKPDLIDQVLKTIDDSGIERKHLAVEITESMVMHNVNGAAASLKRFQDEGVLVCMDDFGTGYSSLNYLKTLPIDVLKIDRTFIKDVTESADDRAIASSIITLGHNLGLKVVAEGVETEEHVEFLREHKCDIAQGYHYGRPLPALEAIAPYDQNSQDNTED
ncbi:MAG: EAL domain-containing protein [Pseudomonadales bacterium]|nr:EAL domain-containing protein [Pseudomonadales bacterium]